MSRKRVVETLGHIIQKIKLYKSFPPNGIAIFSGYLNEQFFIKIIEPPKPVRSFYYRCSNRFELKLLRLMIEEKPVTGILSIDATEAGIGITDGFSFTYLEDVTSGVSGKSSKGGSSSRRYERNRDAELNSYFHRVAEHANNLLLKYNLVSLIVSGPGFTKDDFIKKEYLDYRLRQKISTLDIEYSGYEGILQTFKYKQIHI